MADQSVWLQRSINQLDIIGMYSTDMPKSIRLKISSVCLIFYVMGSVLDIKYNCVKLEEYVESFATFLPTFFSVTFLLCFLSSRKKIHKLMYMLRNDFHNNDFAFDAEIISNKLIKYSQFYIYFTYFGFILFSIQAYLERDPNSSIHDGKGHGLPCRAWYPCDLTKTVNFCLCFIYIQYTILTVLQVTIPIAMCFASMLIHLRAQLFYLEDNLQNVCEISESVHRKDMLRKCLELHLLLIEFTEQMQDAFANILFIHNYSASIVISVAGYQSSLTSVLDPTFLPFFCQVNYVLAECFVYCYYGQHIIDQSSRIGLVAYSNKWYDCPPDIGKDMSLIVMRCQKPLRLVFLGSTDSSLETYYNIVKTGYSYFVFIANMAGVDDK